MSSAQARPPAVGAMAGARAARLLGWPGVTLLPMMLFGVRVLPVVVLDVDAHRARQAAGDGPQLDGDTLTVWEWPESAEHAPPSVVAVSGLLIPNPDPAGRRWRDALARARGARGFGPAAVLTAVDGNADEVRWLEHAFHGIGLVTAGANGDALVLDASGPGATSSAAARRFTHAWEREASLRLRDGDEAVLQTYHQQGRLLDAGTRDEAEASAARAWLGDTLAGHHSVLLVDDNAAAARLSGQLRTELVRLGQVDEHGVALAQGTVAGVGDLVQARWNGWDLAGVQGNRRGPINRETYKVTAVRDDGALDVTLHTGREPLGPDGQPIGQHLVLPAAYVAEHLALAYACTVHAAQGRTTDTSHAVITSWTSLAALYVALSRGREANTAHVATTSTIEDPAQGRADQTVHRNPLSLLAGILDDREPLASQSALAIAADSAARTESLHTPGELLADAAQIAATERTARWLDQLTAAGYLTADQRAKVAAEDGAASLARVLRRVEVAGLDARQVLVDAVTDRPLTGATNTTNVIAARITEGHTRRFDPQGDTWADWVPRTDSPEWTAYLADLAAAADRRTTQLGRDTAAQPPAWAVEALGPVPTDDAPARQDWERRAGIVAAHRELRGHHDEADALGRPPNAGQVEAYAAYRAAWTALGRPEVQQAEHEMSTGAHRARIRAWEREQAWAPRYVGNELAGTRQAAVHHHQTAQLRRAEAAHNAQDGAEGIDRTPADAADAGSTAQASPVIETHAEPDLREVAAREPRQTGEDRVGVPEPQQLAATVRQARRAIHEIDAREAYERQAAEDHRAEQLSRWHDDDQADRDTTHGDTLADRDDDALVRQDHADYQPAGLG